MNHLVLFQKQILHDPGYEPAKVVSVFKMTGSALEEALKQVRYNYTPYALSFKELPPEKLLVRACEEAVRAGRGQLLPLATKPKERGSLASRIVTGLVVNPSKHNANT